MWKKTRRSESAPGDDSVFVWVENEDAVELRVASHDIREAWFICAHKLQDPWSKVSPCDVIHGLEDGAGMYIVTLRGNIHMLWLRTALEILRTNVAHLQTQVQDNQRRLDTMDAEFCSHPRTTFSTARGAP